MLLLECQRRRDPTVLDTRRVFFLLQSASLKKFVDEIALVFSSETDRFAAHDFISSFGYDKRTEPFD